MPMPPFESRSVGLPEVPMVAPGWTKFDYQNPAETFLSAYQIVSNANARRNQIEQEAARLKLEDKRINLDRELGLGKLHYQMESADRRATVAEGELRARNTHETFMEDKYSKQVDDISGLAHDVGTMKSKPGDPGYIPELNDIFSNHPNAAMTASGRQWLKTQQTEHNKGADLQRKALDSDENALNKELKADRIPTRLLNNPQVWVDKWVDKNDKLVPEGTKGAVKKKFAAVGIKDELDPTVSGGIKKVTDYTTVPASKLEQYQKRYQNIQQRRDALPSQVTDTSTGVVPTTSSPAKVKVSKDGKSYWLPSSQAEEAVSQGYTVIGQ